MRLIIALCAALTLTFTADAKPKKARFQGKLLSYSQLMMLPTQKRVAYMRDVASLLVYMEKSQRKYNLAQNSEFQEMKEQFAQLMNMMAILPEAQAAETQAKREVVPTWDSGSRQWTCRDRNVRFDDTLGTCVYMFGATAFSSKGASPLKRVGGCSPENSVAVTVSTAKGKFDKCIPNSSWEALSRSRQADLRAGSYYKPGERFKLATVDSTIGVTLGAGLHNSDGTVKPASGVSDAQPVTASASQSQSASAPAAVPAVPAASEVTAPPVATVAHVAPDVETLKPVPPGSDVVKASEPEVEVVKPVSEKPTPTAEVQATDDKTKLTEGQTPPPEVPKDPKCEAPKFACETDSNKKDELIRRFRANKDVDMCVSGGFFTPVKAKRTLSAPVCEVKRGHDFGNSKVTTCKGKEEALCNPVVFCVGLKVDDKLRNLADPKKGRAEVKKVFGSKPEDVFKNGAAKDTGSGSDFFQMDICVKTGQNITQMCNVAVEDYLNGRSSTFGKKSLGETYIACDPAKVEGLKFQQGWNDIRDNVEKYFKSFCIGGSARDFKELFCSECEIISKRMMAMNFKAANDACAIAEPTSGGVPASSGSPEAIREKHEEL